MYSHLPPCPPIIIHMPQIYGICCFIYRPETSCHFFFFSCLVVPFPDRSMWSFRNLGSINWKRKYFIRTGKAEKQKKSMIFKIKKAIDVMITSLAHFDMYSLRFRLTFYFYFYFLFWCLRNHACKVCGRVQWLHSLSVRPFSPPDQPILYSVGGQLNLTAARYYTSYMMEAVVLLNYIG